MKVINVLDAVLRDYELNARPSIGCLEYRIRCHLRPHLGGLPANRITRPVLLVYASKRRAEGASNATIEREIAALRRGFRLSELPWPRWEKLRQDPPRQGFFTEQEFERLIRCSAWWTRAPLRFAYITGWRLNSEVLPLQWDHVDLATCGRVWIDPGHTKNGDGRVFPLNHELRNLLVRQRRRTRDSCPWIFHRWGRRLKSIRTAFENARKRTELQNRLIHDLRRSAARHFIRSGVSEAVAMKLGGWRDRSVFARYNVTDYCDLVEATVKIDRTAQRGDADSLVRARTSGR